MSNLQYYIAEYTPTEIYSLVLCEMLHQFPKGYWVQRDSLLFASDITNYMFDYVLHWNNDEIKRNVSKDIFHKNKLGGMLKKLFNNNYFLALENAKPGVFKRWEFKNSSVGNDFWNRDSGIDAVKWLIEYKLKLQPKDVPINITKQTFIDNNLGGMLQHVFFNSPFIAINSAYPNKYTYEQFNRNRRREYKN